MILSKEAGLKFQMDHIDMPQFNGYNYILRVVNHLSKFGYVCPIKTTTSTEVGKSLLCTPATSIMPRILQSDNGGEVRFRYFFITFINFFPLLKPYWCYSFFHFYCEKPYWWYDYLPFIFRLRILLSYDSNICLVLRFLCKIDPQRIPFGAHGERETTQAFNTRMCRSES